MIEPQHGLTNCFWANMFVLQRAARQQKNRGQLASCKLWAPLVVHARVVWLLFSVVCFQVAHVALCLCGLPMWFDGPACVQARVCFILVRFLFGQWHEGWSPCVASGASVSLPSCWLVVRLSHTCHRLALYPLGPRCVASVGLLVSCRVRRQPRACHPAAVALALLSSSHA